MGELLLILSLGSPSFKEREKATEMLNNYLLLSDKAIQYARKHSDPEIHRRMQVIELNQRALTYDILTENFRFPWIDKLPDDYPDRSLLLEKLRPRDDSTPWNLYREATRKFMRGMFVNGDNIIELFELMAIKEINSHEYRTLDIRYKLKWPQP